MPVELKDITVKYGEQAALERVSLRIAEGELLALLGPSGSGKSTLLFVLAGFRPPDAGAVLFGERDMAGVAPRERRIGMVFQDQALWPHLTVGGHLDFVLKARRVPAWERKGRVRDILDIVELAPLRNKVPSTISGGEAQRLALARALVTRPQILLLDEPLGALDRRLREKMLRLIRRLHDQFQTTTVYVTHDYDEALHLAHRVAVLDRGTVQQVGSPGDVYHRPANARVAELSGPVSLVAGERAGDEVRLSWGTCRAEFAASADAQVVVPLRPEQVEIRKGGDGVVRDVRFRSGRWEADVEIGSALVTGCSREALAAGDEVSLSLSEPLWAFAGGEG
jgi:ABC-type Fe3+/spermidine/putrescine transport system ATPase subunit